MMQGSEQKMLVNIDDIPTGIISVDSDWKVMFINKEAAELTGYPVDEATGMRIKNILAGSMGTNDEGVVASLKKGEEYLNDSFSFLGEDDRKVVCSLKAIPKTGPNNTLKGATFFLNKTGSGSNAGSYYINAIPTVVMGIDNDYNIIFMNQAGLDMVGEKKESIIGKKCHDVINTPFCKTDNCLLCRTLKDGQMRTGDSEARLPNGTVPIRVTLKPMLNPKGEIIGAVEQITDISMEMKVTEEIMNLVEAGVSGDIKARADPSKFERNYRKIVEGTNQMLDAYIAPLKLAALYVEKIAEGEIPAKITQDFNGKFNIMKDNLNKCIDAVNNMVEDSRLLTEAAISGNFEMRADESKHVGDYAKVIHGVNQTLDRVVDRMFWYEQMLDSIPFPLSVTDMDMNMTFINKASENILKVKRKEVLGKHCSYWNGAVCNTKNCGIIRLRAGEGRTHAERNGKHNQIDVGYILNASGEKIGHMEVLQDVTAATRTTAYNMNEISRLAKDLHKMSVGDYDLDTTPAAGDDYTKVSAEAFQKIFNNVEMVKDSVLALGTEAQTLVNETMEGRLDTRADLSKHFGMYKEILEGVNATLDSLVGHLETIPMPLQFMNKDLQIQYINRTGAELLGSTKKDLQGKKCADMWKTTKCRTAGCPCDTAMRTNDTYTCENDCKLGAKTLDINCVGAPLRDRAGQIIGSFEFVSDQSEIKQAARASLKVNEYRAQQVKIITQGLEELATGDLTVEIPVLDGDEDTAEARETFVSITAAIDKFKASISQLLKEVESAVEMVSSTSQELASSAEEMNASTEQVSSAIQEISKGSQSQAAQVEETAKIMVDISTSVDNVVKRTNAATDAAKKASDSAISGKGTVKDTVTKMQGIQSVTQEAAAVIEVLGKRSEEIGEIVDVITGISDQTNLLALNAAIEAARAGEQGRGFAVVAEEVKNLAEDSREAAERIAKMIKEVQTETSKAVQSMKRGTSEAASGMSIVEMAGKAFADIAEMTVVTANEVTAIAALMAEQKEGTGKAAKSVDGVASIAEETASSAQESAASTEELTASMEDMTARAQALAEMAENLSVMASKFKFNIDDEELEHVAAPAKKAEVRKPAATNIKKVPEATNTKVAMPSKVKEALSRRGIQA
jgi:methyl-accepting chemotaxis protein